MIMVRKKSSGISVEKLISVFREIRGKRPISRDADYSRWYQSEEDYQQEQAEWLESVRRKKRRKASDRNSR